MKPFNLEEAKAGKTVCTRDGKPVRIICYDAKYKNTPIIALIDLNYEELIMAYTNEGKWSFASDNDTNYDLFMVGEKREGWINLYRGYTFSSCTSVDTEVYPTEQDAKIHIEANQDYLATVKIEWEE